MKDIHFQMNRKLWLAVAFCLFAALPALAQKITVHGTVVDATGEPLIGASVIPQGTTAGTATDFDGAFTLSVDSKAVLVVSYVGYETQSVAVAGKTTIQVVLKENTKMLDEVVAIGYGTVKKTDATGAVNTVKPSEVQAGLATSAQDLLVGKAPGVVVTSNGGQPEGGASIKIRGGASLNATNDPLIVIDGVPMDSRSVLGSSNPLALVSPDNIENMTILKDASATAIYGSRASNGVIIITTKKGKSGKPQVSFSANMYVNTPRNYMKVMDGDQFRSFIINEYGAESDQAQALGTANTNWQKEILRTSISHDYNLSVGGTSGNVPYRVTLSYTNNNGIVKTTKMDRVNAGLTLNPTFFKDLLKVNLNLKGAYTANHFWDSGSLGAAMSFNPTLPVYNPAGNVFKNYTTYVGTAPAGPEAAGSSINTILSLNPVAMLLESNSTSGVWQSIGNIQFDFTFPFLRDLRANLNLGYDVNNSHVDNVVEANSPQAWKNGVQYLDQSGSAYTVKDGNGTKKYEHQNKSNYLLDFYLNYKKEFTGNVSHNLDVTAGYSYQRFNREGYNYTVVNTGEHAGLQALPTYYYKNRNQLISFFGRVNYGLLDRYLVTVTVREDGTSRFSKEHRWGTFPAAALAWKVLNEPFMAGAREVLNDFKLRAGWGITGQQDLGDDYFPYLPVYSVGTQPFYTYPDVRGGNGFINPVKANGYNTDLKWEETTTWNAGVDIAFLNNRVIASADFYKRNTKDLLSYVTVDAGSNLTNALNTNIGSMENIGVEVNLDTRPVVTRNFTWGSQFNIAWNKNKITKLSKSDDPNYLVNVGGISAGNGNTCQAHKVGHPASSFLVYKQVYDEAGNPLEGVFEDRNGDGEITPEDKYLFHSPDPKVTMSWSNTFTLKGWDLGIVLRSNLGNYMFNDFQAGNSSKSANASVPLSNLLANAVLFNDLGQKGVLSDYFVQNASFVRCDNITLGYTWEKLCKERLRLRLYGAVQNPFVITKYKGLDPEVAGGIDNAIYPRPITFTLGLVANF